jgi:hypothetical protein
MVAEPSWRGDPNAVYALGHDPEESAGLQRQADELAPERRSWNRGRSSSTRAGERPWPWRPRRPGRRARELAVTVATNADARELNEGVRTLRVAAGEVDDGAVATGMDAARTGTGDRVVTRRNDNTLAVANREAWTVSVVNDDGSLVAWGKERHVQLPAEYRGECRPARLCRHRLRQPGGDDGSGRHVGAPRTRAEAAALRPAPRRQRRVVVPEGWRSPAELQDALRRVESILAQRLARVAPVPVMDEAVRRAETEADRAIAEKGRPAAALTLARRGSSPGGDERRRWPPGPPVALLRSRAGQRRLRYSAGRRAHRPTGHQARKSPGSQ